MAVNGTQSRTDVALLACGRDAAEVWDRVAAGRCGVHERDCPHCQAVAQDQRLLAEAITALADEALEPPPSLVERVMGAVLAELRPTDYLPLPTRRGRARIDRIAAARVLRHAVDQMSELRVRSCQINVTTPPPAPPVDDTDTREHSGADLATAGVHITVTARFGADLLSATARVRQMMLAAAENLLGVPVAAIDVDVVDVFDDPARRIR